MNQLAAHLSLVVALILSIAVTVLGPAQRAAASHLPPPSEIVVKQGDLPPGLEPVEEAGTASLLPDGLARQAAASFRRDPPRNLSRASATSARSSWRSTIATPASTCRASAI